MTPNSLYREMIVMPWFQAPAKINLGLWVGPRNAQGYHVIDTVMQGIGFSDQLYIESRDYMLWESIPSVVPMDECNLVVRAYRWAKTQIPELSSVYGRLEKVIWAGAGLGGGSSDAAALLRWAFQGSGCLKDPKWIASSQELGMDVPFFIRGGAARAKGYGEQLTAIPSLKVGSLVLANPGVSLSTAQVYEAYDTLGRVSHEAKWIDAVVDAMRAGDCPRAEDLKNDLEEPAFHIAPRLREFKEHIARIADGSAFSLSGSGPSYYLLGSDEEWADWMARRLLKAGVPFARACTVAESW